MRISRWLMDSLRFMNKDTIAKVADILILRDSEKADNPDNGKHPKDDHGHFYPEEGAPCPHDHGKEEIEKESNQKSNTNNREQTKPKSAEEVSYIDNPIDGKEERIKEANMQFPMPDPNGKNIFAAGWNEKNAKLHYKKHLKQYRNLTIEQYIRKAINLLEKPVGRDRETKNMIQGYLRDDWCVIRYDGKNFAIGNPYTGVIDMFQASQSYYDTHKDEREWC